MHFKRPFKALDNFLTKLFIRIGKRIRFVIGTIVMSSLMLLSTFFFFDYALIFIILFIVVGYFITYFAVLEGIEKAEWIMLFLMPVLFAVSFYIFYFLFPVRWLTRVPFIAIFGFCMYALLLTSNIFNVGVEKSLQLYRAAFSVNYFLQTLLVFLLMNVIFSFRFIFFLNGLTVFVATFPLALQLLWSVKPKVTVDRKIVSYAFLVSFILMEVVSILSFIPLKTYIFALYLTAIYYSLGGLIYNYLDEKLFKQTIREYIIVLVFVTILVIFTLQ